MTDSAAFSLAATFLVSIGLATGITLRVLHRRPYAPMLALIVAGGTLQVVARVLVRDWPDTFLGLGFTAAALGLLAWDAR